MPVSSAFKLYAEQWLKGLKEIRDSNHAIGPVRADADLTDDQASEVNYPAYTPVSDEPTAVGGSDKGPNPLDYFMAAIGFCENATVARYPERVRIRLAPDECKRILGPRRFL